jgi:hypothetical protein
MAGKQTAVSNGDQLVRAVAEQGDRLGLEVTEQFRVGRRLWGAIRKIDVILTHPQTRKTLGIECKCQSVSGTAEEKIPSTIQDIAAWPIPGIVVFSGEGFSENMKNYLIASGRAVALADLEPWLCLFFGLPLSQQAPPELGFDLPTERHPPKRVVGKSAVSHGKDFKRGAKG